MGFAPTWLRQVSPLLHMTTLTTVHQWVGSGRVRMCGRRANDIGNFKCHHRRRRRRHLFVPEQQCIKHENKTVEQGSPRVYQPRIFHLSHSWIYTTPSTDCLNIRLSNSDRSDRVGS